MPKIGGGDVDSWGKPHPQANVQHSGYGQLESENSCPAISTLSDAMKRTGELKKCCQLGNQLSYR